MNPPESTTIGSLYLKIEDFVSSMEQADSNARPGFEREFMNNICERYDRYGEKMFLTEKQHSILERLAWGER